MKEKINATLDQLIGEVPFPHNSLYEGAKYILLSGGKRIRPLLTLATVEMLGGDSEWALIPACTIELIHTYSLVHDDLPCMDNDDFRRGKATLHKVYNEGHALLVGDFLLTYSFEVLAKAPHLSAEQRLSLITTLAEAAGGEGMIGGQVLDLAQEEKVSLKKVHSMKTGALFRAALQFGGIIATCTSDTYTTLTHLGEEVGFLFQIVDDILDQEQTFSLEEALHVYQNCVETLTALKGNTLPLERLLQSILEQATPYLSTRNTEPQRRRE